MPQNTTKQNTETEINNVLLLFSIDTKIVITVEYSDSLLAYWRIKCYLAHFKLLSQINVSYNTAFNTVLVCRVLTLNTYWLLFQGREDQRDNLVSFSIRSKVNTITDSGQVGVYWKQRKRSSFEGLKQH